MLSHVSGCRCVRMARGGRGASNGPSSSRAALPETLQLLQPVADPRRHG